MRSRTVSARPTAFFAMAALALLAGCTALPDYEEVVRTLPTGEFLEIDGFRVHVEAAGESGSPVVLVHGFGGSTYSWRRVQPALSRNHRVVAVDLFGFGLTQRPRQKKRYTRAGQVDLLAAVLDHLGHDSAHFVGHSYGGGIVMSLAHRYPTKVRSLVLVDSTAPEYGDKRRKFFVSRPTAALLVRALLKPARVRRSLERSFFDDDGVTTDLVRAYFERLRIEGAARAYAGLTAPAKRDAEFGDLEYRKLEQPTLVVWGADDTLIDAAGARETTSVMPRARFVEIPECGHIPMEEQPEALLEAVLPFLQQVDAEPDRRPQQG